jgi:hypothetical protein
MTAPDLPPVAPVHPHRRRLLIAVGVTAIAAPILVIDNLPDADDATTTTTLGVVAPSIAPDDRPETGPPKGISVVTSSTTSSTQPIVITTTTLPD